MDEKAEIKMAVHQILIKNGFYRLPMQSLSDILKILEMPESIEPKFIQENAISGLMKVVEKYANKLTEYINLPKYAPISNETKEYVLILLQDTQTICSKKTAFPTPNSVPPLIAQQMAPSMPPIYPPMGQMPMTQMPYMRPPPIIPPVGENSTDAENMRLMEEQMRLQQQMCMYYYSMYGGFPNPMFNPGMGGFMNPYGPYPPMPTPGKPNSNTSSNPMNPMMNPMMGSMNPMNPMSPMNPMNPMNPMSSMNPLNPMGMNPKLNPLNPLGSIPPRNPLMSSQVSSVKSNNSLIKNPPVEEANSAQKAKEADSKAAISTRIRSNQQDKDKSAQLAQQQKAQLQQQKRIQRSQKRKNLQPVQKPKLNIQNPPFLVGQSKRSFSASNIRQNKPNTQPSSQMNPLFRYCACRGSEKYEDCFLCSICNQSFHYKCLSEPLRKRDNKQAIECYHCRMRFIDPLNRVKEVIGQFYINNISENKFITQCNLKPYEHLCRVKGSKNEIEMRCLKVCHSDSSQITWPDQCIIKLHGERIIEIPALQINSSLKKRKDYSILITPNVYSKVSESEMLTLDKVKLSMEIRTLTKQESVNKKVKNNYIFAFAIYFVQKLTIDELFLKIINEEKVPETPDYLHQLMKTNQNDVQIDKITVSLQDPYTWERIKTPVRGHKCQHGQCFDLHTFIAFMYSARNRSWKCPVCNKDARKFMIDSQQQEIIKRVTENGTEPSEIAFMKDGTIVLKSDPKNDDQEEPALSSRCEKTKKINKDKDHKSDLKSQKEYMEKQSSQIAKESSNKIAFVEPPNDVHEIHSQEMKD